ncbi:2(OG)-Fe(II) oxygenase superfamily protein [Nitzschia inconspicua]|uniref:2(OG)-Fe(II) oxygenase superfamily protein n=1 Tax=Nitzschia inconspicua TaxID=303405 RepID=A0A9K3KMN8_9STRA|nr:2(OG)-Fe(II) oxygenase superfamily protein [Nitzschia inconspicua]
MTYQATRRGATPSASRRVLLLSLFILSLISCDSFANTDENLHCHELSSYSSCLEYDGCGWDRETEECFDEEPEDEIVNCYELVETNRCSEYSGCRWENITNECYDIMPKWIREGQMVPLTSLKSMLKEMEKYNSAPPVPEESLLNDNLFVVLPNCLHPEEVDMILAFESQLGPDTEKHDRNDDLEYHHTVHRIEPLLKQQQSTLFRILISTMIHVDKHLWNILETEHSEAVFPEVEFITYNASPKTGFAAHRDNGSLLTAVFMLSRESAFEGGELLFDGDRTVKLNYGECVIFRGDSLIHQVQSVTKGTRKVLQIELHQEHASEGGYDDGDDYDETNIHLTSS